MAAGKDTKEFSGRRSKEVWHLSCKMCPSDSGEMKFFKIFDAIGWDLEKNLCKIKIGTKKRGYYMPN